MRFAILKPNVSSFGYAVFLAINASSIWGGVFPFLPLEFQTPSLIMTFYLVQSASLCLTFFANMARSYIFPATTRRISFWTTCISIAAGSLCLIAPLYLPRAALTLMVLGGLLLGSGCANMFLLWQRLFALQSASEGTLNLLQGTGYAAIVYAVLHLVPIAVTAFIIPVVLVPLCGLCLLLGKQGVSLDHPMLSDEPRDNARVYQGAIRHYWKSALCVSCLGFASGVVRALAIIDPSVGSIVNMASMVGALASSAALLFLWRTRSFQFDVVSSFKALFPIAVVGFLLLPFLESGYLEGFAGIAYMLFAFATMIMIAQCAQASRDRGINPTFIYGFFSGMVYSLQGCGFILGRATSSFAGGETQQLSIIALLSVCFLSLALYVISGFSGLRPQHDPLRASEGNRVEFIASQSLDTKEPTAQAHFVDTVSPPVERQHKTSSPTRAQRRSRGEEVVYRDRLSMQCAAMSEHFLLSSREAEVTELIARGFSAPHMAETLVVSENTIRTHKKHIYAKLGVHKQTELLDLLEYF